MKFEPSYTFKGNSFAIVSTKFFVDYELLILHIAKMIREEEFLEDEKQKFPKGEIYRTFRNSVTEYGVVYVNKMLKEVVFTPKEIEAAKEMIQEYFPKMVPTDKDKVYEY